MSDKILVAGSLNMDMILGVRELPRKGESILTRSLTYLPGGKGANQAFTVAMLGGDVAMLGCVGQDSLGDQLIRNLARSGADTSHISPAPGRPTGMAIIAVDETGDNSLIIVPGANDACDTDLLKREDALFQQCSYALFQMEIPYDALFYGIRRAKELGKTVILNPAPAPDSLPDEILNGLDFLTPNETELLKLTGRNEQTMASYLAGANELLQKGVKNVLVTLGAAGALLVNASGSYTYPAFPAKAVDATAAGDCFNGALAVGLSEHMELGCAIRFANAASSLAVQKKGAQASIPARHDVDKLLTAV